MDAFLKTANNPAFGGTETYRPMAPHRWGPSGKELLQTITRYIDDHAPANADLNSWSY